jgi:hypothetical protein
MPLKDRFPIMERINLKIPDVNDIFEQVHLVSALNGFGCKEFEVMCCNTLIKL